MDPGEFHISIEDEFLQWLRLSLPPSYLINRDKNEVSKIRIWIGDNRMNTLQPKRITRLCVTFCTFC
jgi:hypothetical protein